MVAPDQLEADDVGRVLQAPVEAHRQVGLSPATAGRCSGCPARPRGHRPAPGRRRGRRGRTRRTAGCPAPRRAESSSASRSRSGQLRDSSTSRRSRSAGVEIGRHAARRAEDEQKPRQRRFGQQCLELALRRAHRLLEKFCIRSRKRGIVAVARHKHEAGDEAAERVRSHEQAQPLADPAAAGCRWRWRTARPRTSGAVRRADRSPGCEGAPCRHARWAGTRHARRSAHLAIEQRELCGLVL